MENSRAAAHKWKFQGNDGLTTASALSIRSVLNMLNSNVDHNDTRVVVPLGHGDPSSFPSFRTTPLAEDGLVDALRSAKFNYYSPTIGILPARRAVSEYLSRDLPYTLSPDDVFMTVGCTQAIEIILTVLARPGANILLPRPGFPYYEARAAHCNLEVRHFDLLPEKGWEVDLKAVEDMSDENTLAMVIINPGNPCGNVFSYQDLKKIAETARKVGIMVITDEVYSHLAFGSTPFTPMGVFASIAPVLTVGSISKRWIVPGWRLGWLVTNDPDGIFKESGIVESIKGYLNISSDPPTFIQGGIPHILSKTTDEFFSRIIGVLKEAADICNEKLKEIPCINCSNKPEGSMFVMVKLELSVLDGIKDDVDFCLKLAKEESVVVMPGIAVGLRNWLRITFAVEPSSLEDGLERMKAFCKRHAKSYKPYSMVCA